MLEWSALKEELEVHFKERSKQKVEEPMKKGIELFIEFLHSANESPPSLSPQIDYDKLTIQPVNLQERLDFIIARPTAYHSFKQLEELMVELEKAYHKNRAIKRGK